MNSLLNRDYFVKNFSERLARLLKEGGMSSLRSRAGVQISQLAKVSGCSPQMARRYVLGDALPEIDVTVKIAQWLKVSPGWLLFGEESTAPVHIEDQNILHIEKKVLEYIILQCAPLFLMSQNMEELLTFIIELIEDVTHIEAPQKDIFKIIDISTRAAQSFR